MVADIYRKKHLGPRSPVRKDEGGLKTNRGVITYFNPDGNSRFGCFADDPDELVEPVDYSSSSFRYASVRPVDKEHVD